MGCGGSIPETNSSEEDDKPVSEGENPSISGRKEEENVKKEEKQKEGEEDGTYLRTWESAERLPDILVGKRIGMHTKLIRSRNFDNQDETGSDIITPDIENRFDNLITTPPGSTTRSSSSSEASSDDSNSSRSSQEESSNHPNLDASEQENVPDQKENEKVKLIPSIENMLPAADTVLPPTENVLPLADKLLPYADTTESLDDKLLLSEDKLLPSDDKFLPSEDKLLPSDDKLLPSDDKLLPSDDKLLPSDDKLLPSTEINLDHPVFAAEEKSSIVSTDKPDLDAVLNNASENSEKVESEPLKVEPEEILDTSEALKVISEAVDEIDASYRSNQSDTNIEQATTVISAWLNTSNQ
ncbi:uncharacterized protein LOC111701539 [Eurytemora carolleeae]|uniref:uncharacterized protein LOC111701539 n=1 Tax=Eurytemora carolleeae TaxID=1294199 RepID=UPI000C792164|nr:uncharacterized protein LOC111701539 [Eurytemora carolleeae]|eukprot:XP_023328631.1 uncharacterized protein LOC111701539 [Eurytemora affinis]